MYKTVFAIILNQFDVITSTETPFYTLFKPRFCIFVSFTTIDIIFYFSQFTSFIADSSNSYWRLTARPFNRYDSIDILRFCTVSSMHFEKRKLQKRRQCCTILCQCTFYTAIFSYRTNSEAINWDLEIFLLSTQTKHESNKSSSLLRKQIFYRPKFSYRFYEKTKLSSSNEGPFYTPPETLGATDLRRLEASSANVSSPSIFYCFKVFPKLRS